MNNVLIWNVFKSSSSRLLPDLIPNLPLLFINDYVEGLRDRIHLSSLESPLRLFGSYRTMLSSTSCLWLLQILLDNRDPSVVETPRRKFVDHRTNPEDNRPDGRFFDRPVSSFYPYWPKGTPTGRSINWCHLKILISTPKW